MSSEWQNFLRTIFLWLFGVVSGVIGKLLLEDSFYFLLSRLFGGTFCRDRGLSGEWHTAYAYETGRDRRRDDPTFDIKTFRHYFTGKGRSTKDGSSYKVRGKLDKHGVVTGTWYEDTKDGRRYYGSFQLVIKSPMSTEMEGAWLGWSRDNRVKGGEWRWTKVLPRTTAS